MDIGMCAVHSKLAMRNMLHVGVMYDIIVRVCTSQRRNLNNS